MVLSIAKMTPALDEKQVSLRRLCRGALQNPGARFARMCRDTVPPESGPPVTCLMVTMCCHWARSNGSFCSC